VISVMDPFGRILGFLDLRPYSKCINNYLPYVLNSFHNPVVRLWYMKSETVYNERFCNSSRFLKIVL
jgi:hypothetical protein